MPIVEGVTNTTPDSVKEGKTDRLWKPWKASDQLLTFTAVWESGVLNGKYKKHPVQNGMILEVYLDSKGYPTVGCGHLVVPADKLKEGNSITYEQAVKLFKEDLKKTEDRVNAVIKVPLFQHEYDALIDIAFNAGTGNGLTGIANEVNKGKYSDIPEFIKTYRTGGGNKKRRESEANLFKSGIYDASH